jgi:hypothetical protein
LQLGLLERLRTYVFPYEQQMFAFETLQRLLSDA